MELLQLYPSVRREFGSLGLTPHDVRVQYSLCNHKVLSRMGSTRDIDILVSESPAAWLPHHTFMVAGVNLEREGCS